VASGELVNRGLLFDHRQGTCERWADDDAVLAALAVAYGDASSWLDLGRILAEIRDPRTREVDGRRYFLNEPAGADSESWLPPGAWQACLAPHLQLQDGADTFVGVDMALRHDSVAVVAVQHHDGRYVARARTWRLVGDTVDVAAVEAHLRALHARYRLIQAAYDPAYFQRSAEALVDFGLPMVEIPQGPGHMVPACQTAYALICAGQVAHDGDPLLADHVHAAVPRQVGEGWRLSKGRSKKKIDACIALVMALDRAMAPREPEPLRPFAY
jgi:phage terminase large subunit-like protein